MAKAGKKASKKRKAKKVSKSPPARAGKKAAKKRAAKKGAAKTQARREEGRQGVEEGCQESREEGTQKGCEESSQEICQESCEEVSEEIRERHDAVTSQEATPVVQAAPVVERAKPATPRAKPASVAKPAVAAERNTYFITTAIAYPNGIPHIGHAYEAIATDALARFQRLDGKDVFFLTGTDEHGQKMMQTAAERRACRRRTRRRATPAASGRWTSGSTSRSTASSAPRSLRIIVRCQVVWNRMQQNGDIYIDTYAGWYSVRDEAYYAEEETVVGEDNVRRGPQGSPVEWVEEKSYFFKLSAYQDRLLALYESQPDFIGPDSRRNEVISFVKGGLKDLSISRTTFDWGVKVPNDPEHVMYVWVDALTNYITGVGFPDESDANWRYWPADVHIIGKDIIRFHAVYWPAFLMSAGIPVQKRVYAHGFLFNRGEKMSKSVGNVVDPFNLADQYGVDQMRYFFLREVPFGQDGNYNHEAIVARINADLANDLGNLAQRSLSMIAKQLGGVLPEPGEFTDNDKEILAEADAMLAASRTAMATQQIHQWLNVVWSVVAEANRYFAGEAPWALAKTDPARQKTVLYVTAEVVRQVAILTQPVMPDASSKLLDSLGVPQDERDFAALGTRIKAGATLPPPVGVFPRYVEPKAD